MSPRIAIAGEILIAATPFHGGEVFAHDRPPEDDDRTV
jgi:hypothetical protein